MASPIPTSDPAITPSTSGIGFSFFMDDVPSTLELIDRAEHAGVDTAWIVMPANSYDTPTVAAAALTRTERITVGTSIVPAFTRHPLTLATQALALDGVAPGRFRLGIGTGNLGTMAESFGTPIDRPVSQLREYATIVRSALTAGAATLQGEHYVTDATLPNRANTPIVLAALGPRAFTVAGEVADAAMAWLCPLDYLDEVARPALQKGAAEAGRTAPPVITHVTAVVNADQSAARTIARPLLETFGRNPQYAAMFAGAGLPLGPDGAPGDELIDAVIVSGNETDLTDQLGELAEREDELLVTLQSGDDRRGEQDTLLRVLGNVSSSLHR